VVNSGLILLHLRNSGDKEGMDKCFEAKNSIKLESIPLPTKLPCTRVQAPFSQSTQN